MNPIDELNLKLGIGPKRPVIPQGLMAKGYKSIKQVGKGAFGAAILVFHKERGAYSIAKEVVLMGMNEKQRKEAYNEILILSQLHHPNIIAYEEQYEKQDRLLIVMEYADGGDLLAKITQKKSMCMRFRQHEVVRIFCQTALAIKYMHDRMVLHRDLKSQNIFLTKSGVVKLGDFGISTVLQNSVMFAKTICGTPFYFSPELCKGNAYNNKSDIWALGCVLYELLTLDVPFRGKNMNDLMNRIVTGQYDPSIDAIYDTRWAGVLASMLHTDHKRRASIDDVCRNSFLRELFGTLEKDFERQRAELAEEKATGRRAEPEPEEPDFLAPPPGGAFARPHRSPDPSPREQPPTHGRRSVGSNSPPPSLPLPRGASPQHPPGKALQPKTRVEVPTVEVPSSRPSFGRRSNPTSPKAGPVPKLPAEPGRKGSFTRAAGQKPGDSLRELDEAFKGLDAAIGRPRPKYANPTAVIDTTPSPPVPQPIAKPSAPQPVRPPQHPVPDPSPRPGSAPESDEAATPPSPMPQQKRDVAKLAREAENLAIFIRTITEQAAEKPAEEPMKDFGDKWASGLDLTMATPGPEDASGEQLPDSSDFEHSFCIGEEQFNLTASPIRADGPAPTEPASHLPDNRGAMAVTSVEMRLASAQALIDTLNHELAEERGRATRLQQALDGQRPTLTRMQAQLDDVRKRNLSLTEDNLLLKRELRELKKGKLAPPS
eukprot:TRINITY_DN4175_c0_g1_i1.p1 TRINITY_DN4175_c0_g1~~TRINITY_DN4175_c0_g1_i1.p1  ORF type:complete len:713 (+),score=272.25 TRINITY_DN4175_c0_g1_i1:46-2184(+)